MAGFYMKCNTGPKWVNEGDVKSGKIKRHYLMLYQLISS